MSKSKKQKNQGQVHTAETNIAKIKYVAAMEGRLMVVSLGRMVDAYIANDPELKASLPNRFKV